jgi:large subunit ribosomal protein L18
MVRVKRFRAIRNRRRSSVTDYKRRIALLKSRLPRVVIRKSNRSIKMQITEYTDKGDRVLASADSKELLKMEWQPRANIPTAYLTGLLLAKKAKGMGANENGMVLDTGLYKPIKSSVVFAAAKGAIDGGLKIANSIEFDQKRLSGQHIADYAKEAGDEGFAAYRKEKFEVQRMAEIFESVKKKMLSA